MKNRRSNHVFPLGDDPLWFKDAIIYEIHVRAFCDSNADGIGDLRGLVEKLDYLQDLGVTALWLLPFYPSPLRDDGYDIADYNDVNPIYGSLTDFKLLMREAHRRGLRVITELVINHTSDRHPWFQRARRAAAGTAYRDFYVWSDTQEKFQEARIIFSDFETSNWTWDPVAKAFYWHRFYSHQPDLNFDSVAVQEQVLAAMDFWLDMGVDGLRLDAIPYLYEREATNCENLPETHAFLKKLRRHADERFGGRLLLAEANQWPEDAVAYFGNGDECNMAFHFPLMPRLFMAIRMEDRFPIIDILQQTPAIPENSQWALFLRNHDELTLEMVTAEDRDYMYRMYAQDSNARVNLGIRRRLAPLLENQRAKIELMNGLLFSLPGTPVLYYGDEIGMGDNIYLGDRNGVRTPMQWTPERNAGFSHANPQRLYLPVIIDPEYHYQSVNVEAQQNQPHSPLWWMNRLIALRKRYKAFGRGTLEFLAPGNHKVLVFVRRYQAEEILVVANLSRFVQCVELDLSAFQGKVPTEMLGRTDLPIISDRPYLLTLGPYAFYWLLLEPKSADRPLFASAGHGPGEHEHPVLNVIGGWQDVFRGGVKENLEGILLEYLREQRWFAGLGGEPRSASIVETIPLTHDGTDAVITLVEVDYTEGEARTFVLPIACRQDGSAPLPVICRLHIKSEETNESQAGFLFDPLGEKVFSQGLLQALRGHRRFAGTHGDLLARTTPTARRAFSEPFPEPTLEKAEQSNTSVVYGDQFLLKVFRCVGEGINPEVEVNQALAEKTTFTQAAPVLGSFDYRSNQGRQITLAALLKYVPHEGTAWHYTLDALGRFFEQTLTRQVHDQPPLLPNRPFLDLVAEDLPAIVPELLGSYLEAVRLLGQRTAELHLALASIVDDGAFAPEPFTLLYQRATYQTARNWVSRVFNLLREHIKDLPEVARPTAQLALGREADLIRLLHAIMERPITAQRIRCHGDCHLANFLYTGKDFVIIDFEGETLRPLSNRRHKRSPLRDVASLLHSWHFAVRTALQRDHLRPEDRLALEPWAQYWNRWVSVAYVKSYLEIAGAASFLPRARNETQTLLDFYLLGRAVVELRYQLLNHPDQVHIPLQALLHLMELRDRREGEIEGAKR